MNPVATSQHLLIVEDDQALSDTLTLEFSDRGYQVSQISSLAHLAFPESVRFDAALVDLKLKSESGLAIVEELHRRYHGCRIVILTGYGSIATAVKAIKLGAANYLTKPASVAKIAAALSPNSGDEQIPLLETKPTLARQEREYIESVLTECDGNISMAAKVLGLHRQSLQRKLRKFAIGL